MQGDLGLLGWHFTVISEYLRGWGNFLRFNFQFYSVGLLARTLFAPWKRQVVGRARLGFDFSDWFTTWSFNTISRCIGAFIRLAFILWSVVSEVLLLGGGFIGLLLVSVIPILSFITYVIGAPGRIEVAMLKRYTIDPWGFCKWFTGTGSGVFLEKRLGFTKGQLLQIVIQVPGFGVGKLEVKPDAVSVNTAFVAIVSAIPGFSVALTERGMAIVDIEKILSWHSTDLVEYQKGRRFWEMVNMQKRPCIGADWAYGYTVNLDKYTTNLTMRQSFSGHLIGREKELARIELILIRNSRANVLIVGEEGVGKKTVILNLANAIYERQVSPELQHKRVLELNVNKVIGDSSNMVEAQNKFEDILEEASGAGNIILVVSDLDRFVTTGEQRVDLSPIFQKMLESAKLQIIGLTTPDAYQKYLYPNQGVARLFERIDVAAPTKEEAYEIVQSYAIDLEGTIKHSPVITYQAVKESVERADRYITDVPFPNKSMDLLDEAVNMVVRAKGKFVTVKEVDEVLSEKTKIPIGQITTDEKDKLINLEEVIHRRLVDQEQAVSDLANAFRRARLQLGRKKGTSGAFLFLGPTGTGKTETAKALAEAYFGSEERLTRVDMNEFQDETANIRLLGDFQRNEPGLLIKLLRDNPFGVLLLDEMEKASKQVLNLFLSAFDEGYIVDNFGKKVSLQDMVVICTSNAGSEFIRQKVNSGLQTVNFKKELIDYLLTERVFNPEFINRFDSVVVYKPLSPDDLRQVAIYQLKDLNKRLKDKELSVKVTDKLLDQMIKLGYEPAFGARPMRRLIADRIESVLAKKILAGEVKRGEEVEFDLESNG